MSTILVPVDFSPASENALRYAIKLAASRNANVEIIHVYPIPISTPDMPVEMVLAEEIMIDARERVDALVAQHATAGVTLQSKLVAGAAASEIVYATEQARPDLIVMGTHGASQHRRGWLGSVTLHVIDRATVPVLAIPHDATFRRWQHICCATDFDYHEIDGIREMSEWVKLFNAQLVLVHINDGDGDVDSKQSEPTYRESFIEKVRTLTGINDIHFEYISSHINLAEQLREFTVFHNSDVLVMLHHVQTGLSRMWKHSLTKDVVNTMPIPLLSYPIAKLEMET